MLAPLTANLRSHFDQNQLAARPTIAGSTGRSFYPALGIDTKNDRQRLLDCSHRVDLDEAHVP